MSVRFFREFIRDPASVGAIAPSSAGLARMISGQIDLNAADFVVEIGPGSGAFTEAILDRLKPGARLIAVENNPSMAATLRQRFPRLSVYECSAVELSNILVAAEMPHADCIVSGLPWAAFDDALQDALLGAILSALAPGGRFATFAYLQGLLLPAGRRFCRKLNGAFAEVTRSPTVWRNLPPAFVYRCRR
ncbi:MAG: methyltransferase domain-containing protein [Phycisphaerae bacterium]|nr:methyltransferase domain-containing protein [Phycisphaerae bacterium]